MGAGVAHDNIANLGNMFVCFFPTSQFFIELYHVTAVVVFVLRLRHDGPIPFGDVRLTALRIISLFDGDHIVKTLPQQTVTGLSFIQTNLTDNTPTDYFTAQSSPADAAAPAVPDGKPAPGTRPLPGPSAPESGI